MNKLKPCPFCYIKTEGVMIIEYGKISNDARRSVIYNGHCLDCGIMTRAYNERQEAVDAWNNGELYKLKGKPCKYKLKKCKLK